MAESNVIEGEHITASSTRTVRYCSFCRPTAEGPCGLTSGEADSALATRLGSWGTDVSGTLQGAGGVGGLLRADEVIGASPATTHYYWYDGNGNVTGLMRVNGTIDATYRYTAFGGKAAETYTVGTFGERNRYRFSTKYLDNEVETIEGTYYYGYRHFAVAMGRWTSRDPIGEEGGILLTGFVDNAAVNWADILGLAAACKCRNGVQPVKDDFGGECCPDKMEFDARGKRRCGKKDDDDDDGGGGGGGGGCRDTKGLLLCAAGAAGSAALDAALGLLPPPVALIASGLKDSLALAHGDGGAVVGIGLTTSEFVAKASHDYYKHGKKKSWWRRVAKSIPGISYAVTAFDLAYEVKNCYDKHCR